MQNVFFFPACWAPASIKQMCCQVQIIDLRTGAVIVKDKMFQKRYACVPRTFSRASCDLMLIKPRWRASSAWPAGWTPFGSSWWQSKQINDDGPTCTGQAARASGWAQSAGVWRQVENASATAPDTNIMMESRRNSRYTRQGHSQDHRDNISTALAATMYVCMYVCM